MKLSKIRIDRRLEATLVFMVLPLLFLFFSLTATAGHPSAAWQANQDQEAPQFLLKSFSAPVSTYLSLNSQDTTPLIIEGRVEQVISEYQADGLIISRAFVNVEKVAQGTLSESQVVIRYQGGTVGDTTLVVSHEPQLAQEMRIWARLTPAEGGDYRIAQVDADLIVLEQGIGVMFNPSGKVWPDTSIPVNFYINPNTNDIPGDGERIAVQNAMNTWSNVSCSFLGFQSQTSSCTAGSKDGVNCVSWKTTDSSYLALTYWWSSGSNFTETDIVFFEKYKWSTNPAYDEYDVESVALHELGHALGLSHNNSSSTLVMFYQILPGSTAKRSLQSDDISGVCNLYPSASPSPPYAPINLLATTISKSQINLAWNEASSNESGFKIERSANGTSGWSQIATVGANTTSHVDGNLTHTNYAYRVRAYNSSGNSGYSNIALAANFKYSYYLPLVSKN